jgi:uncharacterized protein YbjT (DUF2867 family)
VLDQVSDQGNRRGRLRSHTGKPCFLYKKGLSLRQNHGAFDYVLQLADVAFRYVDYSLPLVFAKAAHGAGVETFALVSAIGAATNSMFFYARTKGEVERDIRQIGFRSLTICRPSIIAGARRESRIAAGAALAISRVLALILPKKFHVNPAAVIAASLLDSVLTPRAGCRWVFAEEPS